MAWKSNFSLFSHKSFCWNTSLHNLTGDEQNGAHGKTVVVPVNTKATPAENIDTKLM